MIRLGEYVVSATHIAGYQIQGATLYVFMASPFFGNGSNIITHSCDSPNEAFAIAQEIRQQIDGAADAPR